MSADPVYAGDEMAALYDLFFGGYAEDLHMYEQFARRGATASLELGAGSGRIALHLARAGLDIVALDGSPAMLRRLDRVLDDTTRPRVRIVEGEMRRFDLGEQFDAIFCAANTFQLLLTTEDQLAALRCIAAHLAPGGVFVAKVATVPSVDWGGGDGGMSLRQTAVDPATGETVMRFDASRPRANELILERTIIYDRIRADGSVLRRAADMALRYAPPGELALLLDRAGLRPGQTYGDHDLSPFDEGSDTMVFVAEHPA